MKRFLVVAVAMAMVVVACGGDGDDATSETTTAASETAGPVTIEHRYGSTTIEETPQRIVSLDNQWTDVLVSMDAPLVGAILDSRVPDGRYPWQELPESVEGIPVTDSIPVEAVAALRPDLIVVSWEAPDEAMYDTLSAIAPTIPLLGDEEVDQWQDIAAVVGDVLGTPEAADALVAESEAQSAAVLDELPGIDGRTYALANYVAGDAIYVVADPDDGAATFFGQLGLSIDPEILDVADGASGRATLSLEQIGMLDADLLVLFTNGADPSEVPGFDSLPAVQSGAVAVLDLAAVSGLNTPTPLSIPYSLDHIRDALEALHAAG